MDPIMILGAFTIARALASLRERGEDRVDVLEHGGTLVVVVADGVGGLFGGARAAELLVERVRDVTASPAFTPLCAEVWVDLLARVDLLLEADHAAGETTGVVMAIAEGSVFGASSGDSAAWIVQHDGKVDDLTVGQHRKLRLGSGRATPVPFSRSRLAGTLVAATDGLFNYARPERIAAVALGEDLDDVARDLIQLVRLPSGALQDDVGMVLVRQDRPVTGRSV
jgi:serine/threonine protein phosphatase PrpC